MHNSEDKLHEEARVRRLFKVFVSGLSFSLWYIVSFCPANVVDSAYVLCFFLYSDYLQKRISE